MAFQKKLAHEAYMQRFNIAADDLPAWLQAALRLFNQAYATAGNTLTPELTAQATELADDIRDWHEEEEEEEEEEEQVLEEEQEDAGSAPELEPVLEEEPPPELAPEVEPAPELEPVPAPELAPEAAPAPVMATDPLTPDQVLMQLHGQGITKVTAAQLKAAGFPHNPGPVGSTWGNYCLAKALFGSTYTLTKK